MINKITIQNFKNIRDQAIDLDRLTVFVGANASGKTSVLEALHLAVRAATGDPKKVFGYERHCDWLYTRGGTGNMVLACATDAGTIELRAAPPEHFPPAKHELLGKGQWTFERSPDDRDERKNLLGTAKSLVFLHLNAYKLAKKSYCEQDPPRVEFDGTGLASVLAYMKLTDDDGFEALEDCMREFVPRLKRIRIRKSEVRRVETEYLKIDNDTVPRRTSRRYQGESLLFDFDNAQNVSAHTASEGTLLLLGLLAVLLGPSHPNVLLMDDIEHGLHPSAQKALVETLRKIMQKFADLQIIATAHSPYLLDCLEPEQIRLITADRQGYAQCGKLTDHPDFQKWKEEMAPGEMWSLFGESWITEKG